MRVIVLLLVLPISIAEEVIIPRSYETNVLDKSLTSEMNVYFYAGDKLIASKNNDGIKYYHADRLGSNRLTTDEQGNVKEKFKSLPFGQVMENTGIKHSFTGKELDKSNLYYFNARYYDSNLGRFTSVDPVEDNHPYSYVSNNPLNLVDPDGKDEFGLNYVFDFIEQSPEFQKQFEVGDLVNDVVDQRIRSYSILNEEGFGISVENDFDLTSSLTILEPFDSGSLKNSLGNSFGKKLAYDVPVTALSTLVIFGDQKDKRLHAGAGLVIYETSYGIAGKFTDSEFIKQMTGVLASFGAGFIKEEFVDKGSSKHTYDLKGDLFATGLPSLVGVLNSILF